MLGCPFFAKDGVSDTLFYFVAVLAMRHSAVKKSAHPQCSGTTTRVNEMKVIRLKTVIDQTGLARSTIYKFMKDQQFPQAISLGARSVGWIESEVLDWIKGRVEASRS